MEGDPEAPASHWGPEDDNRPEGIGDAGCPDAREGTGEISDPDSSNLHLDHAMEPLMPTESVEAVPDPDTAYWVAVWRMLQDTWPYIMGNTLEWYEFSAYGYLIPELQENFFKGSSVLAWLGFAITFAVRPLGGIILGWVSDRFGRRVAVITTLTGMIGATVLQGCLPSHLTNPSIPFIGNIGLLLMVVCRMAQGLFTGGEISAVSVTLGEHSTKACLGMAVATISIGGSLAFFLSAGLTGILHSWLTDDQMMLWGWRIPFLLVLLPGSVALLLRLDMPETEAFLEVQGKDGPEGRARPRAMTHFYTTLRTVFCEHTAATLIATGGTAGISALWYVGPVYTCDYLVKFGGMNPSTAFTIGSLAQLVPVTLAPVIGWLTDRVGVGKVILAGNACVALVGLPVYYLLVGHADNTALVAFAVVGVFGFVQALAGTTIYLWAVELFETPVRTTGMGASYNMAVSYFGGFGPLIVDWLAGRGYLHAPGIMISVCGLLSTITVLVSRSLQRRKRVVLAHIRPVPY